MPRIRTIKPEHWNDRELTKISLPAHLLWIGTWNFSDDKGIFEGDPILIKSQIFPRRTDVRVEQISQWLDQLAKARYIIPFTYCDGQGYYINRTFETHQRIDKPQPSKFDTQFIKKVIQEHSKNVRGTFRPVLDSIVQESIVVVEPPTPEMSNDEFSSYSQQLLEDKIFNEQLMMARGIKSVDMFRKWVKAFNLHIVGEGKTKKDYPEYKRHFKNWIQKQNTFAAPAENDNSVSVKSVREQQGEKLLDEIYGPTNPGSHQTGTTGKGH